MLEENSSSKQKRSSNQDSSNKENISNKQVRSGKQNSSRKQDSSNKQDRSSKKDSSNKQDSSSILKNFDPDCLMEKFSELYNSGYASIEQSRAAREHAKEILVELLRVKAKTKRQYKIPCKKCEE